MHPLALLDRQAEIRVGALERLHPSRRCHLSYRAIAAISISSHQYVYALVCNARGVNIFSTDRDIFTPYSLVLRPVAPPTYTCGREAIWPENRLSLLVPERDTASLSFQLIAAGNCPTVQCSSARSEKHSDQHAIINTPLLT